MMMDIDGTDADKDNGIKKKTSVQLQSLEIFYSEEKWPKQNKIEEYASTLDLTYKQVCIWFTERRRKERRVFGASNSFVKSFLNGGCRGTEEISSRCVVDKTKKIVRQKGRYKTLEQLVESHFDERKDHTEKKLIIHLQTLVSKDYILKKTYRKDGPALGKEFDPPPGNVFGHCAVPTSRTSHESNPPATKDGMGKGLMTVWHATQSIGQKLPDDVSCTESGRWMSLRSNASQMATSSYVSRQPQQGKSCMRHSYQKKSRDKKNQARKEEPHLKDCMLSLDESSEQLSELLIDDEALELEELQAGPNLLSCTAHLTSNGRHGCPLCKDLLARFPPQIVKMKQLFSIRPWNSSPRTC